MTLNTSHFDSKKERNNESPAATATLLGKRATDYGASFSPNRRERDDATSRDWFAGACLAHVEAKCMEEREISTVFVRSSVIFMKISSYFPQYSNALNDISLLDNNNLRRTATITMPIQSSRKLVPTVCLMIF